MGAMFGNDQRPWLGQIKHLARAMVDRHRRAEGRTAAAAGFRKMIKRDIRGLSPAQGFAGMPLLATRLLTRPLPQATAPEWRLRQTIAGRRLAAIAAVQPKLPLKFSHPRQQKGNLSLLR
jgi:hypothetical protein